MKQLDSSLSYKQLAAFFIPLGFSASLTSFTHVIINGTLSRGDDAAFYIACYAVAFALFGLIEKPIIVFRQTCSALVKDIGSFKLLIAFLAGALFLIIDFGCVMAFGPLGDWVYLTFFNADENIVYAISQTFKVIMIVIIFSGIRGIYQGIIIQHLETQWLTIGVVVRLLAMFLVAFLFVAFHAVSSLSGAVIFLTEMFIECSISVWKGHGLLKQNYQKKARWLYKGEVFRFYLPLVFYFVIQAVLNPITYVFLSKSNDIELGIASFARCY